MTLVVWLSLVFLLVAVLGSLALAALRGWRAWRSFRSFNRRAQNAVADVLRTAEAAEAHATALTMGADRLNRASERLQASLAELSALREAAGETTALLAAVRGVVPRK
jgi:hypothetical protein